MREEMGVGGIDERDGSHFWLLLHYEDNYERDYKLFMR